MQCPACDQELVPLDVSGGLTVDVCRNGCGGVWFDHRELERLDPANESSELAALEVESPEVQEVRTRKRPCPRCQGVVMRQRFYGPAREGVEIDECPACGGIWLDAGELRAIREELSQGGEEYYDPEPKGHTYYKIAEGIRNARKKQRMRRHWGSVF